MTASTYDELVKAAVDLAPRLVDRAADAEGLGRLPDDSVEDLANARLLCLSTPGILGGHQAPLRTQLGVFSELARGCGSTSWVAAVYAVVGYMVCSLSDEAQDEFFSGEVPIGAGVFSVKATATQAPGGFRLSGRWPFCSGQHHAGWVAVPAQRPGADGQPDIGLFLVPKGEFTVADDWKVVGLVATGSNTVALDDVFVPAYRSHSFIEALAGRYASERLAADPYYQAPLVSYLVAASAGTPLGLARAALDQFRERVGRRGITYTNYTRQADAAVTHLQMAEATMKLDQAQFHAQRLVDTLDSHATTGAGWDMPTRVRCRADLAWCVRLAREVIDIVQAASGASAIHRSDPLQIIVRDTQTLSLHSFLLATTNAELYGRVLCGVDPGVPYF